MVTQWHFQYRFFENEIFKAFILYDQGAWIISWKENQWVSAWMNANGIIRQWKKKQAKLILKSNFVQLKNRNKDSDVMTNYFHSLKVLNHNVTYWLEVYLRWSSPPLIVNNLYLSTPNGMQYALHTLISHYAPYT